ncbi:ATP-binding protein [Streptococcus dysgalactiae subsp. equisimilis]|uniref:ATP-binding protein n=1 Tax=Streptococcus dysgalactiae TaxID=1334 RepID=UPI00133176FF|nr:ATP-binding protein [Streptococcus dysgalactiae]MCY7235075.1 ATP-binding protein [Streptococcus dysgalactiae]
MKSLQSSLGNIETVEVDEICVKHGIKLYQISKKMSVTIGQDENGQPIKEMRLVPPFCPQCQIEQKKQDEENAITDNLNANLYLKTYNVLMSNKSYVPNELKTKTFDDFNAITSEEKRFLEFAKGQVQKYLDGMRGNTLITGGTGIGKTLLSVAIAKSINEGYKTKGEPKSVLFVSLTEIIKQIKEGWNYGKGATLTEFEAIELMKSVDYLIIDDLGAKNAVIKSKSDWEQDLLFDVLNNRENTIFNTNLDSDELKTVYNERNYSRILKGLEGNTFKAFGIKDKRYSINQLKSNM